MAANEPVLKYTDEALIYADWFVKVQQDIWWMKLLMKDISTMELG